MESTSSSNLFVPKENDGESHYSDSSIGTVEIVRAAKKTVMCALESAMTKTTPNGVFSMCDYGSSDGGTSMFMFKECIDYIQQKGKDTDIMIYYEDQPLSDFKSVFIKTQGYLNGNGNKVFISTVGKSFFEQCLPSQSVYFGFSSSAMQWLSRRPCNLKEATMHLFSNDPSEREAFKKQAARDWENILLCRAKELVVGGQMVVSTFSANIDGKRPATAKYDIYDAINYILLSMLDDGLITKEEFVNTTFDCYNRNELEFSEPFLNKNSAVYNAGLRLVSIESKLIECVYHKKWIEEGDQGDASSRRKYAKKFVDFIKVWSSYTILSGLLDSRSDKGKKSIIDEFFQRLEDDVAMKPEDHLNNHFCTYVHFEKADHI